jgi:hypothetical protein
MDCVQGAAAAAAAAEEQGRLKERPLQLSAAAWQCITLFTAKNDVVLS